MNSKDKKEKGTEPNQQDWHNVDNYSSVIGDYQFTTLDFMFEIFINKKQKMLSSRIYA